MGEKRRISNIEQGILNDEVRRTVTDSQMTTGFFMLRPGTGWETNHSQMTTSFFILRPGTGWEMSHSHMTMSFFNVTKVDARS